MMIGVICSLLMVSLISNALYLEAVAVDNRLAEMRAYWATMGHFRYALSRTGHSFLCIGSGNCDAGDKAKDSEKAATLQSYLDEISAYRTFTYPEENVAYSIKINLTAAADDDPSRQNFSGHLMMTSSYPILGVSTLPVLLGLATRFTPYQLRFCAGLASAAALCGAIGSNNGGANTAFFSVKRFYRMASVS